MSAGIIEIDVHRMTKAQARVRIDAALRRAGAAYRLRVIHGYNSGTELLTMVRAEYKNHPKVLRVVKGVNQGETELVLREY